MDSYASSANTSCLTFQNMVDRHSVATLASFDFGGMSQWPFDSNACVKRIRYRLPVVGAKLYELQSCVRNFQEGLELERETFSKMHDSINDYIRLYPNKTKFILSSLFSVLARKMGEGMIDLLDPNDTYGMKKMIDFSSQPSWHASEEEKCVIDSCQLSSDDMNTESLKTLNASLFLLVNIGFLATRHYSVMRRYFYFSHFERVLKHCFQLSKEVLNPHAATILFASIQRDEKKRSLVLQKCGHIKMELEERVLHEKIMSVEQEQLSLRRVLDLIQAIPKDIGEEEHSEIVSFLINQMELSDYTREKLNGISTHEKST